MPYVRTHGNQLAIVHGTRDGDTGKVVQRILFTFYSKKEAAAAIGEAGPEDCQYFQLLLKHAHPQLKFDFKKLGSEIRQKMKVLPDIYPLRQVRSQDIFEKALDEFVRQMVATAPSISPTGRETLRKYAADLCVLQSLVNMYLKEIDGRADKQSSPFDLDERFCWRYELQGCEVPADLEEYASALYRSGDYEEAKKLFSLLVRCFPEYAEGNNYLGLIALSELAPREAVDHFRATARLGRKLFPRRMAKEAYWSDLNTRPYMRGLMNLGLALNQSQQYRDALQVCHELYRDCGSKGKMSAAACRAVAYLNLHNWQECVDSALEVSELFPSEGFVAGFALFELGRYEESIEWFLHASLNSPHTACLLLDKKKPKPATGSEVDDHNSGLMLFHSLPRFFRTQSKASCKFFRRFIEHDEVRDLLSAARQCTRNHFERDKSTRENFDRWQELKSRSFARKKAKELVDLLGYSKSIPLPRSPKRKSRKTR